MKKFAILAALLMLAGCVEEEENVSDRSIRGRWYLRSMRLSQPVDLNRDGVGQIDMVNEFGCLYDENILISNNGNNFTLNNANLFQDDTQSFYCDDAAAILRNFGDVEKVDAHTIRLHFVNESPEYAVEYTVFDDVMSKTYTASVPTVYDDDTQSWSYANLQIRKEYVRED